MTDRILLVEDDPDQVRLTTRAIERGAVEAEVEVARDGLEAVETLLAGDGDLPSLVLLDLDIPRLDGFQVLERIRGDERTRRLPVVVLTSSTESRDRLQSYELGANSFVSKPVNFTDFSEAVEAIGRYWLSVNEQSD